MYIISYDIDFILENKILITFINIQIVLRNKSEYKHYNLTYNLNNNKTILNFWKQIFLLKFRSLYLKKSYV